MTTPTTYPWRLELHKQLGVAIDIGDGAVDTVIARWFGAPVVSDCPTPGQASAWTKGDWEKWAAAYNYASEGRTAHSYLYRHKFVGHLAFGIATSPGDFRTPMAMAREVRCGVREIAPFLLAALATALLGTKGTPEDEDDARRKMGALATAVCAGRVKSADISAEFGFGDGSGPNDSVPDALSEYLNNRVTKTQTGVAVDDVNDRLRVLKTEFDLSPRAALKGIGAEEVDSILERLRLARPGERVGVDATIVGAFNDLIDQLREQRRQEKEAQKQARAAKEAARTAAPSLCESTRAAVGQQRSQVVESLHGVEKLAQSLIDRVRLARDQVPGFFVPEFEDVAPVKDALRQAQDQRQQDAAEIALLKQQLEEAGDAKTTTDQVAAARAFADVTVDVLKSVAQMNPFQMVSALQTLQQQAEELKATLAPKAVGVAA
jgi:Asp/Glu/hydantoin racemase